MILQALTKYYDILISDPVSNVAPLGYSTSNVSFILNLSERGELLDIFPVFETIQRGNKTMEVPRRMIVPRQVKRSSGIRANFLCDNCTYVLGISGKETKDPDYAMNRFEEFKRLNKEILAGSDCIEAKAVVEFLDECDPQKAKENPIVARHIEDMIARGGNLVFRLEGKGFIHDSPEIRRIWEKNQAPSGREYMSQCLVTGEIAAIARLHPSLKGIRDANPTGVTLVGFNARAYESYNRIEGQGLNSPVSEKAAFAYTTALNYLLSRENPNPKFTIGDATVIYWAESPDRRYTERFAGLFEFVAETKEEEDKGETARDRKAEGQLMKLGKKVRHAEPLDEVKLLEGLDKDTRFYILGLSPNAGRVSVRFFYTDPFWKTVQKIMAHYRDMEIEKEYDDQPSYISVRQILWETVPRKATNPEVAPLLAGAVMRAILGNTPYPAALYTAIINRIRADADDKERGIRKVNFVRAAVIKACLKRKYRHQDQEQIKEVLCMSLNKESTNQTYLLGRLFAVLEKAQMEAVGENIGASIKDRYFTSACATPATVFPALLRLSQHHISRAEYGYATDRRIEEIMDLMEVERDPFPAHLSLDKQGLFVLGYYHQRHAFYIPKGHTEAAVETKAINPNTENGGDKNERADQEPV